MDNCGECAELLQDECEGIIGVCPESPVVRDYNAFTNKPSINGVTLVGNKTSEDLGITQQITEAVQTEAEARQTADEALQQEIDDEETARTNADTALDGRITANATAISNEALARQSADNGLQSQIDAITSKSDVVDVVANYAALQAYDTSTLGNNDVIKVLDDETHEDALTYYRWSTTTQTWSYIGQEAPYYSKGQMDTKLAEKQDKLTAGANIQIQNGTISATDTTYTNGYGLNLNGTEFSADTNVLATKEDLEGYYTKPETDNLLAPKLEAELVAVLPPTGTEGKLYLTPKAHTTQTATGNPITATITEQAGKMESFRLDGDTFQQSYTGKNLANIGSQTGSYGVEFDYDQSNNTLRIHGTPTATFAVDTNVTNIELPAGTYTISLQSAAPKNIGFGIYTGGNRTPYAIAAGQTSRTITLDSDSELRDVYTTGLTVGVAIDFTVQIMLEKGGTATSYEPFVGGTPSPNPDYPQPIQTVTGLQTVTINGTGYPLDLGTIELNGLGDDGNGNPLYKDRIYKDGNDWKVHKETDRLIFDGGAYSWSPHQSIQGGFVLSYNPRSPLYELLATGSPSYQSECSHFLFNRNSTTWTGDGKCGFNTFGAFWCINQNTTTIDAFLAWMEENNPALVFPLATPTDTTITDQTLIAQLEAIRTASLQNGANTISNTATGSNLAGDMGIGYYGYNPRNRYDKWLWLDINNEYEQIGS